MSTPSFSLALFIRVFHFIFALSHFRQQMFEFDDQFSKKEDAYHFVAYLPISGRLYELDGLQEGPIDHGSCDMENWLMAVKPVLEKRMQRWNAY